MGLIRHKYVIGCNIKKCVLAEKESSQGPPFLVLKMK